MSSAHFLVRQAIAEVLRRDPPVCDRIDEQRDLTLPATVAAGLAVFRDTSRPAPVAILGAPVDWTTRIRVLIKARAVAGMTADEAADALSTLVHDRVMRDPSLGGLASDTEVEELTWDQDDADTGLALALLTFLVVHRTSGGSLS